MAETNAVVVVWEGQRSGVRERKAVALVDGGRLPALGLCVVLVGWLGEENSEAVGGAGLVVGGQGGGQIVGVDVVVVVAVLDMEPEGQVVGLPLLDFDSGAEGVFPDGEQCVGEKGGHWRSGGGVGGLPDGPRRAVS